MKIAAILHFPEFGGPHNQLLRLHRPLAERGADLVAILPEGPGAKRLREGGLDVRTISLGRVRAVKNIGVQARMLGRFPLDILDLVRLFRKERPDVIQVSSLMNPHAAYAAKMLGIPVVWQIVDTRPPMKLRQIMMAQIRYLADVVMPIGEAVRDAHPGAADFGDRSVLFFPPVDLEAFQPDGAANLRTELGIDEDQPIVSVIGNINPQKGHEYFLQSAALIKRKHPSAVFVVVGHLYENHRDYFETLLNQAEGDGLVNGSDLHFLGSRQDIPEILRSTDVFALASVPNSEGLPTVILEAMACGVPVVASDVASVAEAVVHGQTGFVVDSQDSRGMADRISALLSNGELRKRFGARARSEAEERYSLDAYADTHMLAYDLAVAHTKKRHV